MKYHVSINTGDTCYYDMLQFPTIPDVKENIFYESDNGLEIFIVKDRRWYIQTDVHNQLVCKIELNCTRLVSTKP